MSILGSSLVAAYRQAHYQVSAAGHPAFRLQVDQQSAPLAQWFTELGAASAGLLTAANPLGERLAFAVNARAQARLRARLTMRYGQVFETVGQDPTGAWPDEAGCLVFALDFPCALALGRELRQNAILFAEACDATPRLVLLR